MKKGLAKQSGFVAEYTQSQSKKIAELQAELKAANHDYAELMKERIDYIAENKRLWEALEKVELHAGNTTFVQSTIRKALKEK